MGEVFAGTDGEERRTEMMRWSVLSRNLVGDSKKRYMREGGSKGGGGAKGENIIIMYHQTIPVRLLASKVILMFLRLCILCQKVRGRTQGWHVKRETLVKVWLGGFDVAKGGV